MHLGMKSLNTAIADLREARNIANIDNLHTAIFKKLHRTSCSDNLPAQLTELLAKIDDTALVADAN
jgi:hypothetical protein